MSKFVDTDNSTFAWRKTLTFIHYTREYLNNLSIYGLRGLAEMYRLSDYVALDKKELVDKLYVFFLQEEERNKDLFVSIETTSQEDNKQKTQEEKDEEFREQYRVEDGPDGKIRYNPFLGGEKIDPTKLEAKFEDTPIYKSQTIKEMIEEVEEMKKALIPIKMEDGRTLYLGETPESQKIYFNNVRNGMKKEVEPKQPVAEEVNESLPAEKPKRKTTRKTKVAPKDSALLPGDEETVPLLVAEDKEIGTEVDKAENSNINVSIDTNNEEKESNREIGEESSESDRIATRTKRSFSSVRQNKSQDDYQRQRKKPLNNSRDFDNNPDSREYKDANYLENDDSIPVEYKEGVLEIMADGYGFLRANNYESGENDAYVSATRIKRSGLRKGDYVKAEAKKICENRPAGVTKVLEVNGFSPEAAFRRKNFDSLTPIYPDQRYRLEIPGSNTDFAIRCIDLVAPIGRGQRSMIVSPPKAGKTTLLKSIAKSIAVNYPEAHLIVLLVDERPEEVTDMKRFVKGEVVYSTFDELPEHHTKAAELVLERAKRLVEMDQDVVILMDSLTRLARAYNLTIAPTGRTLSGGVDPGALYSPKRFFGAARNIENGGSLTIIATALVDTGSRMDDVIYEEFKGTGNMEIHLDRRLSERRIFPAIDLYRSGTRRDEMLLDQDEIGGIWGIRKMLSAGGTTSDATETLINMMIKTKTNKEFIEQLNLQLKRMKDNGYLT